MHKLSAKTGESLQGRTVTRECLSISPSTSDFRLANNTAVMAQEDCALISLPPEIRNIVYELVFKLGGDRFGVINIGKRPKSGNNATTYSVQALLQTCRQIYGEGVGVFYAVNCVSIPNLKVKTFLDAMRSDRLASIRQIAVYGASSELSNS